MYDNINVKYEDASCIIGILNSFRVISQLKKKIKDGHSTAQDYAFIANAYNIRGESKKAFRYAMRSIQKDRRYAYAYFIAGQILFDRNKYKKAEKYISRALKLAGNDYYLALFYRAELYIYDDENFIKAYETGKSYFDIKCDYPDYYLLRAILKMQFSLDFKEVFADIWLAFKSFIKYKQPLCILEGIYVLGCVFFARLIMIIVNKKEMLTNRANALAVMGRDSEILELYKSLSAKKKFKEKEELSKELLNVYFNNENYKKCIALANKFLVEYKSAYVYMYKARSYDCLGKYDKAIENLDKAYEYDDEYKEHKYYFWKAKFNFHADKYKDAIKYINKQILYDESPDPENYMFKGVSNFAIDDIDASLESFLDAFRVDKGDFRDDICWWLARLYHIKNENNKALIYVDIALMENKDYYNYAIKGDILTSLKRIKEANECYKKASMLES